MLAAWHLQFVRFGIAEAAIYYYTVLADSLTYCLETAFDLAGVPIVLSSYVLRKGYIYIAASVIQVETLDLSAFIFHSYYCVELIEY
jgi:hypothetical protein